MVKNNNWKIGFWIYFGLSIIVFSYLFAKNINNEVDLAFTKIDKIQTEKDLELITEIINRTNFSKEEILKEIKKESFYKINDTSKNKIELEKIILVFENEKLIEIEKKKNILDF